MRGETEKRCAKCNHGIQSTSVPRYQSCHSTQPKIHHTPSHDSNCFLQAGSQPSTAAAPAAPTPQTQPTAPVPPAPPVAAPSPVPAPNQAAPTPGVITAADLERAMAAIQAFSQPKSVSLKKLLSPENVAPLLNDEAAVNALIQHLPEGIQNAHELLVTLHSPQLRQSIGSLVNALQSGNFNAVLANFGLDPAAGAAKLAFGDGVGAFLDAIQHWANQQDSSRENQTSL